MHTFDPTNQNFRTIRFTPQFMAPARDRRLLTSSPIASSPTFIHEPNTRPPNSLPYSRLAASPIREGVRLESEPSGDKC